jgi:hypothetical protein
MAAKLDPACPDTFMSESLQRNMEVSMGIERSVKSEIVLVAYALQGSP